MLWTYQPAVAMRIRSRLASTVATETHPKKPDPHRNKPVAWRPIRELRDQIEAYRVRREAEEWVGANEKRTGDRRRFPLSGAIEELVQAGLEREDQRGHLSQIQADSIESKLDIALAELDDIVDRIRILTQLVDVIGPRSLASVYALAAWMARDAELRQIGEPVEVAQERLLDELHDASLSAWRLLRDGTAPPITLVPDTTSFDGSDGELLTVAYVSRERGPQATAIDVHWFGDEAVVRRLDAWARGSMGVSRNRAISALVELALDIAQGRLTVPLHRAAELDDKVARVRDRAAATVNQIDFLRQQVETLGSEVISLPDILVRWQAQDPEFNEDTEAAEAAADRYSDVYRRESVTAWQAIVAAIIEPDEDDDDNRGDLPLLAENESTPEGHDRGNRRVAPYSDDEELG